MNSTIAIAASVVFGMVTILALGGCSTGPDQKANRGGYFIDSRSGDKQGVYNIDRSERKGDFRDEPAAHRGPFTDQPGVEEEWGK